jgi:hypothetical protein
VSRLALALLLVGVAWCAWVLSAAYINASRKVNDMFHVADWPACVTDPRTTGPLLRSPRHPRDYRQNPKAFNDRGTA